MQIYFVGRTDSVDYPRKRQPQSHTLREEILAGRNFGEGAHSPILVQFGGIYFGDLLKFLNLARINFGEWPINLNLEGRNFGEFGEFFRRFAKFAKITCRQNFFS